MHGMLLAKLDLQCADNGRFGMFKPNFDKYSIVPLFHPSHPDIVDNKIKRFKEFFQGGISNMFARNSHQPKFGKCHIMWRKPFFGRLQSSNEDVEAEMNGMREHEAHADSCLLLLGGDGLSEMRMEHALARDPRKWVFSLPMVLPIRGESPHGLNHVLHGGWRLWWCFINNLVEASDQSSYVKSDFSVSDFSQYDHTICTLIRGVGEFLEEVSIDGNAPTTIVEAYINATNVNLDAAYLVHFLYDFGFMYWQFRQAVRDSQPATLDLIWRESTAIFNTREGHKTQYAPMNVTHIYRQEALLPEIRALVDNMRTLSMTNQESSDVGWDMPTEMLNNVLRTTVHLPYEELITKKIESYNFTSPVCNAFGGLMHHNRRNPPPQQMRNIDRVVNLVKAHLYKKLIYKGRIGPIQNFFATLTEPSTRSLLDSNLTGKKTPWRKAYEAMVPPPHPSPMSGNETFEMFIRRHLDIRVTW
jgi:hypothetical protein